MGLASHQKLGLRSKCDGYCFGGFFFAFTVPTSWARDRAESVRDWCRGPVEDDRLCGFF
jgi:hypothetical protein